MDILCEKLAYPLVECMWIYSSGWNWKCSIFSSYVPREPTKHARPLTMLPQRGGERAMKSERQWVKKGEECGGSRILQLQWQLKWFSFSIADAIKIVFDTLPGRQTQTEPALPSPGPEQPEITDTSVNEVATSWACRPLLSFGQVLSATVYGSASRHRTQSRDLSIAKSFHAPDEC